MRGNRLSGVLAREKRKREAGTLRYGYVRGTGEPARPWRTNRGHWLPGTDRRPSATVDDVTGGVTGAR